MSSRKKVCLFCDNILQDNPCCHILPTFYMHHIKMDGHSFPFGICHQAIRGGGQLDFPEFTFDDFYWAI